VQLGKVYENLMVDLRATNKKLWDRGARIVATLTDLSRHDAMHVLREADGRVKVAVVMHQRNVRADDAARMLEDAGGNLRAAIAGGRVNGTPINGAAAAAAQGAEVHLPDSAASAAPAASSKA
jgi:N-acetylmuramic acid 6-phosphate etherase